MENDKCGFMGKFPTTMLQFCVDGRFLFSYEENNTTSTIFLCVLDLFYSEQRKLPIDFGQADERFWIYDLFAIDLNTSVIIYESYGDGNVYVGIGNVDLEAARVTIENSIQMAWDLHHLLNWTAQSNPPNLHDGVVLQLDVNDEFFYATLKMKADGSLELKQLDLTDGMKLIGVFDGCLYGLLLGGQFNQLSVELKTVSLENQAKIKKPTTNLHVLNNSLLDHYAHYMVACIGRTAFIAAHDSVEKKTRMCALDLSTLRWERTSLELADHVRLLHNNNNQTLIMCEKKELHSTEGSFHRFVYEPDRLTDCVWLRLKCIFDSVPGSYDYILSQLPSNFKPRCPFSLQS
ncbi:hypothetical protein M3Y96_00327000 [Aphelenchoides besseyi]|nr:hypothetical protein M3Y96_00327000 [Aphelenchoides besseyi]